MEVLPGDDRDDDIAVLSTALGASAPDTDVGVVRSAVVALPDDK